MKKITILLLIFNYSLLSKVEAQSASTNYKNMDAGSFTHGGYATGINTKNYTVNTWYDSPFQTSTNYMGHGNEPGAFIMGFGPPLPVELIIFQAFLINDKVELKWQTVNEHNNDFFTIEKSKDGNHFEELLRQKSKGNSGGNYEAIDENPFYGWNYYRLKQTDFDGKVAYSKIIKIKFETKDLSFKVYPNPNLQADEIHLSFSESLENQVFVVNILDLNGKIIQSHQISIQENQKEITLSKQNLQAGIYLILVLGDEIAFREKIILE